MYKTLIPKLIYMTLVFEVVHLMENGLFLAKVLKWPLKDGNWLGTSRVKGLQ